jgi:hypothetical protein
MSVAKSTVTTSERRPRSPTLPRSRSPAPGSPAPRVHPPRIHPPMTLAPRAPVSRSPRSGSPPGAPGCRPRRGAPGAAAPPSELSMDRVDRSWPWPWDWIRPVPPRVARDGGGRWRRGWDSNPRTGCPVNGFRDRPIRPLWHLSGGDYRRRTEPPNRRLAERVGFEPTVGGYPTHAFQACTLSHSVTSPQVLQ